MNLKERHFDLLGVVRGHFYFGLIGTAGGLLGTLLHSSNKTIAEYLMFLPGLVSMMMAFLNFRYLDEFKKMKQEMDSE